MPDFVSDLKSTLLKEMGLNKQSQNKIHKLSFGFMLDEQLIGNNPLGAGDMNLITFTSNYSADTNSLLVLFTPYDNKQQ